MTRDISIAEARKLLRTRARLDAEGWRESDVRRALKAGELRRVQRNRYIDTARWADLWPESQHLVEVVAAAEEMTGGQGVASHASAAVVHGVPLYRHRPAKVELTIAGDRRMSSRAGALRHDLELPQDDVTQVDGIWCTTLERTVFDVARSIGREAAVACADAALRREAMNRRSYDEDAAAGWRERMTERVAIARGARGIRQAEAVVAFADGRAELPGESVGRLQLARLGFRAFELQVRVPSPAGNNYEVDIGLPEVRSFFEFDGKGKYLDESLRSGRTVEEVLLDEKRREDWIRGTTQWRLARGGDAHIVSAEALGARLAAFHIHPPSPRRTPRTRVVTAHT